MISIGVTLMKSNTYIRTSSYGKMTINEYKKKVIWVSIVEETCRYYILLHKSVKVKTAVTKYKVIWKLYQ